jgi:CheY-like chemotaxis protein
MAGSPHVLIAEDEVLVALSLSATLEDRGFRVTLARNGLEAIQADEADPADILVTDMRMPVMDGASLIRHIRERRPDLPIIVMTGYSSSIPAEEPGQLTVLVKPFKTDSLTVAVGELLNMQQPPSAFTTPRTQPACCSTQRQRLPAKACR